MGSFFLVVSLLNTCFLPDQMVQLSTELGEKIKMVEVISTEKFKSDIFDFESNKEWIFEKSQPIILNFFATWCGPCHMFAPTLEDVASEYADKLRVFKMDIDASPEIAHLFGIKSVPTTVFLVAGEEPAIASGLLPRESMQKALQELLGIS